MLEDIECDVQQGRKKKRKAIQEMQRNKQVVTDAAEGRA